MQRRNDGRLARIRAHAQEGLAAKRTGEIQRLEEELESADRAVAQVREELKSAKRSLDRALQCVDTARSERDEWRKKYLELLRRDQQVAGARVTESLRGHRAGPELPGQIQVSRPPLAPSYDDTGVKSRLNWLEAQVRELNAHLTESRSAIPALEARYQELAQRIAPKAEWPEFDKNWDAP